MFVDVSFIFYLLIWVTFSFCCKAVNYCGRCASKISIKQVTFVWRMRSLHYKANEKSWPNANIYFFTSLDFVIVFLLIYDLIASNLLCRIFFLRNYLTDANANQRHIENFTFFQDKYPIAKQIYILNVKFSLYIKFYAIIKTLLCEITAYYGI